MATREALQIPPEWKSDCSLRVSIPASHVSRSTFLTFNGDTDNGDTDSNKRRLKFVEYFYEPVARIMNPYPAADFKLV